MDRCVPAGRRPCPLGCKSKSQPAREHQHCPCYIRVPQVCSLSSQGPSCSQGGSLYPRQGVCGCRMRGVAGFPCSGPDEGSLCLFGKVLQTSETHPGHSTVERVFREQLFQVLGTREVCGPEGDCLSRANIAADRKQLHTAVSAVLCVC